MWELLGGYIKRERLHLILTVSIIFVFAQYYYPQVFYVFFVLIAVCATVALRPEKSVFEYTLYHLHWMGQWLILWLVGIVPLIVLSLFSPVIALVDCAPLTRVLFLEDLLVLISSEEHRGSQTCSFVGVYLFNFLIFFLFFSCLNFSINFLLKKELIFDLDKGMEMFSRSKSVFIFVFALIHLLPLLITPILFFTFLIYVADFYHSIRMNVFFSLPLMFLTFIAFSTSILSFLSIYARLVLWPVRWVLTKIIG